MPVNGNIPVARSKLPPGDAGVDRTVQKMVEVAMGKYGAKSPKVRALAIDIVRNAGVPEKEYGKESVAIFEWVRDNIRYVKDPVGQETLSHPEELLFNSMAGDCDDQVIAVMALLGSLGIMSYPVVIGTNPQTFTHVYLHAVIPQGKHHLAGQIVPMDPIMKWSAGREALPPKVKRKKVYPQYAGLHGVGSLNMDHSMLPGMGEYVSAPSYLDTEDSQARVLLAEGSSGGTRQVTASKHGMVNSQGTLATTTKSVQGMGGVDGMFVVTDNMIQEDVAVGPDRVTQSQQDRYGRLFNRAPQPRDARNTGPLGPITARNAMLSTKVLESERAVEIPTLAKADQATRRKRSFGQKKIVAIKNGNIDQVHLNTRGNVAIDPPKQDVAFGGLEGDVPRAAMRKSRVLYQGPRESVVAPRALNRMYQKNIQSQTEVKLDAATPQAIPSYAKYRNLAYGAGLAGFPTTTNKLLLGAVALGGLFLLMKKRG